VKTKSPIEILIEVVVSVAKLLNVERLKYTLLVNASFGVGKLETITSIFDRETRNTREK
jgi:hypothetical protein